MKTLITITLAALLTACGSGTIETTEAVVKSDVVTLEPLKVEAPTVVTPEPAIVKPEPVVTVCAESNGCEPSPVALPVRNVTIIEDNQPVCVRDSAPLVMIDGVLTDNCGNKYGNMLK